VAKWQDQAEFINQNSRIAVTKLNSPQNARLGSNPPTIVTYYHINTDASSVNKGLQNVNELMGSSSGNRFNKIKGVPLWGIDTMDYNLDDSDAGLDTNIDGSFKLPPNVFYPFPDDFFIIDHLNRPFLFRVTKVDFDTPNAKGFFRAEFELWSSDTDTLPKLEESVSRRYHCIMDHIGTTMKAVVSDDEFAVMHRIQSMQVRIRDEYLDKFRDKGYNALMFNRFSVNHYLYDPLLNYFCNRERVFEVDDFNSPSCYLLYEEIRNFHTVEYETSIYDRLIHRDLTDLDDVACFYDMELTKNDVSIFDFNKDFRVKYVMCHVKPIGPFGNKLDEYIPVEFLSALKLKNSSILTDVYERFIFTYMVDGWRAAEDIIDTVDKRRMSYNMHNYIFIPLTLYVLRQIYNSIVCDIGIMDEQLLNKYSISKGGNQ
jgi:hypothetical protein